MVEISVALALTGLSFMVAIIWGGPLLRVLRHFKLGKIIRVEEPTRHLIKMGTPTMGGVMFIFPVLMLTVLLNAGALIGLDVLGRSVLLPMLVMLAYAVLGALDDWEGIRGRRRGSGMRARTKFLFQVIIALGAAITLYRFGVPHMFWTATHARIDLGLWYIPLAVFVIVSESNAVNFTDGLDGLAGLISVTAFVAYGIIAVSSGFTFLGRFCFTLVGALFGFLWFNVHPAGMIMGDTGALSLGATLGVVALMTGQWLLLPFTAVIPLSEALSVVLQIGYFKLTKGKRLFKMAPFHLHFELLGWSETQVVQRFWLISLLFAMLGIALAVW
jgi:phospho-N-acetylmuramoyl-pentapeptide-transferase